MFIFHVIKAVCLKEITDLKMSVRIPEVADYDGDFFQRLVIRIGRLHNEELNDLYSSPNIVQVIKWRRMRWPGHVARMGEVRGVYRVLVGKPEGKRPLGRPRRRWWIILGWISRRLEVGMWTGLGWPRIETGGGRL